MAVFRRLVLLWPLGQVLTSAMYPHAINVPHERRFGIAAPVDSKLHRMNPHPRLDPNQLGSRARRIRFWGELYTSVGGGQILAAFGLNAGGDIREGLMDYLEETRLYVGTRALGCVLGKIHLGYGATHEVGGWGNPKVIYY